jgi:hypothetical protein
MIYLRYVTVKIRGTMFCYSVGERIFSHSGGNSDLLFTSDNGKIRSLFFTYYDYIFDDGRHYLLSLAAITDRNYVYLLVDHDNPGSKGRIIDMIDPRIYPARFCVIYNRRFMVFYDHCIANLAVEANIRIMDNRIKDTYYEDIYPKIGSLLDKIVFCDDTRVSAYIKVGRVADTWLSISSTVSKMREYQSIADFDVTTESINLKDNGDLYVKIGWRRKTNSSIELIASNVTKTMNVKRGGFDIFYLVGNVLHKLMITNDSNDDRHSVISDDVINFYAYLDEVSKMPICYYITSSSIKYYLNDEIHHTNIPSNARFPTTSNYDLTLGYALSSKSAKGR